MPLDLSALASRYARSGNSLPPLHLGTRYDRAGVFQPEPGNTVVCHVVPGSATERVLVDARARYRAMADAASLTFTPVESYHMTLFQGIIEGRRNFPYWPADIAADTPIVEMTRRFRQRLERFPALPGFAVRAVAARPTGLVVEGVTAADRHAMATWRNALAESLGYRHPDHDSYQFHITMAYMIDWLDDAALPAWATMLEEVLDDITRRAPILELRAPAFCSFEDMNWFEELLVFEARQPVPATESA